MAKRKKLNKRTVVFLSIFGIVLLGGVLVVVISQLPKDPEMYAERARIAMKAGNFKEAQRNFSEAIRASNSSNPKYYYELAQMLMEKLKKPGHVQAAKDKMSREIQHLLQNAARLDQAYVEPQKALTDIYWKGVDYSRGDPGQSVVWFQRYVKQADKLLKLTPDDHQTWFRKAIARTQLIKTEPDQIEKAIADFTEAIRLKGDEALYRLELAQFYLLNKQLDQAVTILDQAVQEIPDTPELQVGYGKLLYAKQDKEKSLDMFQQAIASDPNNSHGYRGLAIYHIWEREYDKAIEAVESAKKIDPSEIEIYELTVSIQRRLKNPEKMADAYRECLRVVRGRLRGEIGEEPTPSQSRALRTQRILMHYHLADLLLDAIDPKQKQPLDQAPVPEIRESLARLTEQITKDHHYAAKIAGRLALLEGDKEKATEFLEKAHQGFSQTRIDIPTANLLLKLHGEAGNSGLAVQILDDMSASSRFKANPTVLLRKAYYLMQYGDVEEAANLIEIALAMDPSNEQARQWKGDLDVVAGRKEIDFGATVNPKMISLVIKRARKLWEENRRAEAVSLLEKIRQRAPENLLVVSELFSRYVRLGRQDKATQLIEQARQVHPDNKALKIQQALLEESNLEKRLQMHLQLIDERTEDPLARAISKAAIYDMAGREDKYIELLRQAEAIDPNSPVVILRLYSYALTERDWELGEEMVQRASSTNLDGHNGALFQARLELSRNDVNEGIRILTEALIEFPKSKKVKVQLASCHLAKQDYAEAEKLFADVVANDPGNAPALVGMAKVTAAQGRMTDHGDWVIKAHRLLPRNSYIRKAYLAVQGERNETSPQDLIVSRERILKETPNDLDNRRHLVLLYRRTKQWPKADEMARSIWGHPQVNKLQAARILLELYSETNRYSQGISVLRQLLEVTNDKVGAYTLYGEYIAKYDVGQARKAFAKAIEADPNDTRGHLGMARFEASSSYWGPAAEALKSYLKLRPDDIDIKKDLIRYQIEAGDENVAEAVRLVDRLIAADPSDSELLMLKGLTAFKQKDLVQAEKLLSRAIAEDSKSAMPLFYRAQLHRSRGDLVEAQKDLDAARQLSSDPRIAIVLAEVLSGIGDSDGAAMVYADFLESNPASHMVRMKLLGIYIKEDRWAAMAAELREARKKFPNVIKYAIYEANMWRKQKRYLDASRTLYATLKVHPKHVLTIRLFLDSLIKAKQYDEAIRFARKFRSEPKFAPWAAAAEAFALNQQGKTAEAEKLFVASVKLAPSEHLDYVCQQVINAFGSDEGTKKLTDLVSVRPKSWRLQLAIARRFMVARNPSEAKAYALKAKTLAEATKDKNIVNKLLGVVHYELKEYDEAEKVYLAVLEITPNDVNVLNNLGYLYTDKMDQAQKAQAYTEKAVALMPYESNLLDSHGWALAKSGRLREAEEFLMRSVQFDPNGADNRYHLGYVYEKTGRLGDAETQYRLAQELLQSQPDKELEENIQASLERVISARN